MKRAIIPGDKTLPYPGQCQGQCKGRLGSVSPGLISRCKLQSLSECILLMSKSPPQPHQPCLRSLPLTVGVNYVIIIECIQSHKSHHSQRSHSRSHLEMWRCAETCAHKHTFTAQKKKKKNPANNARFCAVLISRISLGRKSTLFERERERESARLRLPGCNGSCARASEALNHESQRISALYFAYHAEYAHQSALILACCNPGPILLPDVVPFLSWQREKRICGLNYGDDGSRMKGADSCAQ